MLNEKPSIPARTNSAGSDVTSSSMSSLKPCRTSRFTEATVIHNPTDHHAEKAIYAQTEMSNIGFGYIARDSGAMPLSSPLKSALKLPGSPRDNPLSPLSPTFREEVSLAKHEKKTKKQQKADLKIKTRVRLAKFALKTIDLSCSLIIISMVTASLLIFNATKNLPPQGPLTAWPNGVSAWPQILVISMAGFSLLLSIYVFFGYCKGGHKRSQKIGTYYDLYNCGFFVLTLILWGVTAAIFENSRANSGNKDIWGWSCVNNQRSEIYSAQVQFSLVCRFQNWTLICVIISLVINVLWVGMYIFVFYRYWTKRQLYKTMETRNRARSDLYLAQLRTQSALNTPGFGPRSPGLKSPALSQFALSPRLPPKIYRNMADTSASPFTPGGTVPIPASQFSPAKSNFKLQAPPKARRGAVQPSLDTSTFPLAHSTTRSPPSAPVADDEPQYGSVEIPGAYAGGLKSPAPTQFHFGI